jgi:hypothetical protein
MDNDVRDLAELDRDILTFDISDEALERAAAVTASRNDRTLHSLVAMQLAYVTPPVADRRPLLLHQLGSKTSEFLVAD